MTFSVIVLLIGAVFLAIGLIGGGIKVGVKEGEASIPQLSQVTRVIAFIIGLGFIIFGIWSEIKPTATSQSNSGVPTKIDEISGTWTGTAKSENLEFDVKFIIRSSCTIGTPCGTFEISTISCYGDITITKIIDDIFEFQTTNKTEGCNTSSDIRDSLQLLSDGTLLYISTSNEYEARGILIKE